MAWHAARRATGQATRLVQAGAQRGRAGRSHGGSARRGVGRLSLALALAWLHGCAPGLELDRPGQLDWTVEGHPSWVDYSFSPSGTHEQRADVLLRNGGGPDSVVWVTGASLKTELSALRLVYPAGKPAFPVALQGDTRLRLQVRFQPDPNQPQPGTAVLHVEHELADVAPLALNFRVPESPPRGALDTKDLRFVNPSAVNPPTRCARLRNVGGGELRVGAVTLETAHKHYAVVKAPPAGTLVPGGAAGAEAGLEICVRLTGAAPCGEDCTHYDARVIVRTDAQTTPELKVQLSAAWDTARLEVGCGAPADPQGGDVSLRLAVTGQAQACCTLHNAGPGGLVFNDVDVSAYDPSEAADAEAAWAWALRETPTGAPVALSRGLAAGKSLSLCVAPKGSSGLSAVGADVVLRYTQGGLTAELALPVVTPSCSQPALLVAPAAAPLWLQAAPGATVEGQVTLANQSCAPLALVKACVRSATAPGPDPCAGPASPDFTLVDAAGLQTLQPWALSALRVRYAPSQPGTSAHVLHVVWCPGTLDASGCDRPLRTRTVALHGVAPGGAPAQVSATLSQAPVAGSPVLLQAQATAGTWPVSDYGGWQWTLVARPAGSVAWLGSESQAANAPQAALHPDKAGTYRVQVRAQSVDPSDPGALTWSAPALVDVVVP